MVALGSSKLAAEEAQEQLAAARALREPKQPRRSPGGAQEKPRRAQEHPQV